MLVALLVAAVCTLATALAVLGEDLAGDMPSLPAPFDAVLGQSAPADAAFEPRAWDEQQAPNYYEVIGEARLSDLPDPGEVVYAPLDRYGRAGTVTACVTLPLMEAGSAREREDISGLHPSGWGSNDEADIELPDGSWYHGYFWNRSHLLAKSLGGAGELENLVCGTRMQNVGANLNGSEGGMAYTESLVRSWLRENPDGFVYYSATPVYQRREPVCHNVVVEVLSSDESLNCEVVVYNAAKGYIIDYATGAFSHA